MSTVEMINSFSNKVVARLDKNRYSLPADFVHITGSYNAAFILQHCFHWSQHSSCKIDDTFYTQLKLIAGNVLLSESTIKRSLKKLCDMGIIKVRKGRAAFKKIQDDKIIWSQDNCIYITVNIGKLNKSIECIINELQKGQSELCENERKFQKGQSELCEEVQKGQSELSLIQIDNLTDTKYKEINKEKNDNDYDNDDLSLYDSEKREPSKEALAKERSKQLPKTIPPKKLTTKGKYLSIVLNNNDYNLPDNLINDWLLVRDKKKAAMTVTAMKGLNRELGLCVDQGLKPVDCFQRVVENSWVGLKASWFTESKDKGDDPLGINDRGWLKAMLNRKLTD